MGWGFRMMWDYQIEKLKRITDKRALREKKEYIKVHIF